MDETTYCMTCCGLLKELERRNLPQDASETRGSGPRLRHGVPVCAIEIYQYLGTYAQINTGGDAQNLLRLSPKQIPPCGSASSSSLTPTSPRIYIGTQFRFSPSSMHLEQGTAPSSYKSQSWYPIRTHRSHCNFSWGFYQIVKR